MKKLKVATKQQIFEHYVEAGIPDVYAFIAAQEDNAGLIDKNAVETLFGSFIWGNTELGHDFWFGIIMELQNAKF